jgi:tetratricopeptide (TPR) repeat protein
MTRKPMWVSDSYEDIYARAMSNMAQGDYESAYDSFQRLSERLSGLKPALLDRRPELRSLFLLSLTRQAEIHYIQGEFEQAMQLYQHLAEIAPESKENWERVMALTRIDMGQVEAGLDELRAQAVAHPGDHRLWLTIGLECEGLGRMEEAEENLKRAARLAPDSDDKTEAYLSLFDFYRAQGRVDEALAAWDQAWAVHDHTPDYIFPLYQMMWEIGDLKRAHEYLNQEENPLRKGFYQGILAVSEGKPDQATKHWKRVAQMDPLEFDEGHEAWAEAALRVDQPPQEVISELGGLLESGNLTPRGLILQAVAEARIGHREHAENVLEIARSMGMRSRPRQEKLPAAHWALFDELVADDEIKHQLRHYFEEDEAPDLKTPPASPAAGPGPQTN